MLPASPVLLSHSRWLPHWLRLSQSDLVGLTMPVKVLSLLSAGRIVLNCTCYWAVLVSDQVNYLLTDEVVHLVKFLHGDESREGHPVAAAC